MPKTTAPSVPPARKTRASAAEEQPARMEVSVRLVELKPGFFLNPDQIVSVRTLPQEEGDAYAVLQLSNGDKLNLTRAEFSVLTGEEPRELGRQLQRAVAAPQAE